MKSSLTVAQASSAPGRPVIGLPYIFYFEDQLPFWSALLWECGFNVEVSPKTNREIINLGLESVLSEEERNTMFQLKVMREKAEAADSL